MRIEVEEKSPCGLHRRVWEFSTHSFPHIHLVRFSEQSRESRRKKWTGSIWCTYDRRACTIAKPVDIPGIVIDEALDKIFSTIRNSNVYIGASPECKNIMVRK